MSEATKDTYDVIIIGGGIGGLICGAFLAQKGKEVIVIEQADHVGGFVREFQHGAYKINPAIHVTMGCSQSGLPGHGLIDTALKKLGVRDQCEFKAVNPFFRAHFPDFQMDVPTGRDAFLEVYQQAFPEDAIGLAKLVNLCSQIYKEYIRFPIIPRWQDWALMPIRFPNLIRYANATLASVMRNYLSNPRLMAAYTILWSYVGLPPSRVSFLIWAIMMYSYIEEGAFYCSGGFQGLAEAFASGLKNHGGEIILNTRVTKIRASNSRVQGISLENGQYIKAPVVISNIDTHKTFQGLLEHDQVPSRNMQRLKRLEPSLSVLGIHLATDLDVHDFGVPKVVMISEWDLENVYQDALKGKVSGIGMHIPTIYDDTLAPPGEHLVILQACIPSYPNDSTLLDRAQFADRLLARAERILPDLRNRITFVEGSTEENHQKYQLHRLGPIYGWAAIPKQSGPNRPSQKTPIQGLFLTGHWTQPGHGIWTVVLSGINTARLVLEENATQPI